jgi:hypothetical protein
MSDIFIHGIIDAPLPPQWLIDKADNLIKNGVPTQATMNNWGDDFTARPLYKDGNVYNNAFNHSVFLDDECLSWGRDNITKLAKDIRSTATLPGLARCGAHIDRTRNYTLMYLLETGGDDHQTVFYQEKGVNELFRPNEYHVDNYDNLSVVSVIRLEPNKWNLLQARILHSIENITRGRRSIQISLDEFPDDAVITNITNL